MEENAVLRKEAPTDKPPRAPWSKKTKIIVWSVVGAVVIAAIVIGIVFGVRANQYKMRTFKKDGITYEEYVLESTPGTTDVFLKTPRGLNEYVAPNGVLPAAKNSQKLSVLGPANMIRYNGTAVTSGPIKIYSKKLKKYVTTCHAIVCEKDKRYHYYDVLYYQDHVYPKNKLIKLAKKSYEKHNKRFVPVPVTKKMINPVVTGNVQFDPDTILTVKNGIVTGFFINGTEYSFQY